MKTVKAWLKARRQAMLSAAFVLLWVAFAAGYQGAAVGRPGLTGLSFGAAGAAALLCVLTQK